MDIYLCITNKIKEEKVINEKLILHQLKVTLYKIWKFVFMLQRDFVTVSMEILYNGAGSAVSPMEESSALIAENSTQQAACLHSVEIIASTIQILYADSTNALSAIWYPLIATM